MQALNKLRIRRFRRKIRKEEKKARAIFRGRLIGNVKRLVVRESGEHCTIDIIGGPVVLPVGCYYSISLYAKPHLLKITGIAARAQIEKTMNPLFRITIYMNDIAVVNLSYDSWDQQQEFIGNSWHDFLHYFCSDNDIGTIFPWSPKPPHMTEQQLDWMTQSTGKLSYLTEGPRRIYDDS